MNDFCVLANKEAYSGEKWKEKKICDENTVRNIGRSH